MFGHQIDFRFRKYDNFQWNLRISVGFWDFASDVRHLSKILTDLRHWATHVETTNSNEKIPPLITIIFTTHTRHGVDFRAYTRRTSKQTTSLQQRSNSHMRLQMFATSSERSPSRHRLHFLRHQVTCSFTLIAMHEIRYTTWRDMIGTQYLRSGDYIESHVR